MSRGRTLIVVAHRLATVVDADQILVLEDGRLQAAGTHAELLRDQPAVPGAGRAPAAGLTGRHRRRTSGRRTRHPAACTAGGVRPRQRPPGRRCGRRTGSRRGTSPRARGSRASRRRRNRRPRRPRTARGTGSPSGRSTRADRSVSSPPRVLRVRMCSRTAISGPASGSSISCGSAVRMRRSPKYRRAASTRDDLRVLAQPGADLAVPQRDRPLQLVGVDQRLADQLVHLATSSRDGRRRQEVDAVVEEGLHRWGDLAAGPGGEQQLHRLRR